ncbi:MAG: ferredoxin family protein [Coriobacteriales bacterium]|nr:ferredoxin family protein [Coriobacteriales bacterium]MBQ6586416.1 ferredoxin family protein [Coriobacteriales bacterium]
MAHIGNEILSAVIDIEACVGCGTCVEACPLECLELSDEGYAVMANAEACVLDGSCEAACPNGAISIQ